MRKFIDLDTMLASASAEERFDDGNGNRIWDGAAARRKEAGRAKLRWLIPAAAAFTVLVSLCAVPQARAAMTGFFGKVFDVLDYLQMEKSARPDNTAVADLVQSGITARTTVARMYPYTPENEWVESLDVQIDEVLYDGQTIFIRYRLFGEGIDDLYAGNYPESDAVNQTARYKEICPERVVFTDLMHNPRESWCSSRGLEKIGDGVWKGVVQYGYDDMLLSGNVNAKFRISLDNITATRKDEHFTSMTCDEAGTLMVDFQFNADMGKLSMRSIGLSGSKRTLYGNVIATQKYYDTQTHSFRAVNRITPIEGSTLEVLSLTQSPVETRMTIRFKPSQDLWKAPLLDIGCDFINVELKAGNTVVGQASGYWFNNSGSADIDLVMPFLPLETERLTVRTTLCYYSMLDGLQLELNKPVALNMDSNHHSFLPAEQEVSGGTFYIDLTK